MEKYYEVIKGIIGLLETMEAGLIHSQKYAQNEEYSSAFTMLQDIINGINTIEGALVPILEELPDLEHMEFLGSNFKAFLSHAIGCYEDNDFKSLDGYLNEAVINYKLWKEALERMLKPFILS